MWHLFAYGILNPHNNPQSRYQQHYFTDRETEALRSKVRILRTKELAKEHNQ